MNTRAAVRRLLNRFGYDIRRIEPRHPHADPVIDQRTLLGHLDSPTIIDVGASVGQGVMRYLSAFPRAKIIAFEPAPSAYAALRRALGDASRVTAHPLAVCDERGIRPFHLNVAEFTNSLLPTASDADSHVPRGWLQTVSTVDVETTTLDDFCQTHGVERVDLLKLDVQGAEHLVLRGARRLLAEKRIGLVFSEVNFIRLYRGQSDFCDVYRILQESGFLLYGFYGLNYARNGCLAWADGLFVSGREPRE